jgi:hypothetical protein
MIGLHSLSVGYSSCCTSIHRRDRGSKLTFRRAEHGAAETLILSGRVVCSGGHDEGRRTQIVAGSFPDARTETSSRSGEIE